MRAEKEKGLAPTAAPENTLQNQTYQKRSLESSSKLQIGEFLLYLGSRNNRGRSFWGYLEAELRGGLA